MTDGETRLIGTVKITNAVSTNHFYLTEAIKQLKDADRCAWKLVRAYDKVENLERLKRQHASAMRKLPVRERTVFVAPKDKIVENAGYIVWKDKNFFFFNTNDLTCIPSGPILDGMSEEAIKSVGDLAALSRWTGS